MLPPEVTLFLREPGRSLVVKGAAGAGKTLFSIALARWFHLELGDVVWLNARDAEPAVVAELEGFVPPEQRIDAAARASEPDAPPDLHLTLLDDLRAELPGGERALLVIDSVSALVADAPPGERSRFERALLRFARERGTNLILIVESSASEPLEYLADGVAALGEEATPLGRLRVLRSQKLRGAPAALAKHPFTLADGAFWAPQPGAAALPEMPARAPARPDVRDRVSTGTHDWDLLLGGGLARGSVTLVEAPAAAGAQEHALVVPLLVNARALGRDVASLLSAGHSHAALERWVLPHLPPAPRGAWTTLAAADLLATPRFGDKDLALEERLTRLDRARDRAAAPMLSILSVDALAAAAPPSEAAAWLTRWAHDTRARGHLDLLVAAPANAPLGRAVADAHWRLDAWEGRLLLQGVEPATEPFFVRFHASRGFPETELRKVQ